VKPNVGEVQSAFLKYYSDPSPLIDQSGDNGVGRATFDAMLQSKPYNYFVLNGNNWYLSEVQRRCLYTSVVNIRYLKKKVAKIMTCNVYVRTGI
jgi:hypothetical protein